MATFQLSLHERQGLALMTNATETFYGGAAGGGKSHLLRNKAIQMAIAIPGFNGYIFRKTYPELMRNHMEGPGSFRVLLAPLVNAGACQIVEKEIRFWNGSKIFLNHLQRETDRFKFQGAEIHGLFFDELTHFSDDAYRYLRGRLRIGKLNVPKAFRGKVPFVMSGGNPGGIGHNWVKRTFVKQGAMRLFQMGKEEGGMLRQFIPSKLSDNPTLTESDPDYADRLSGLGDPILVRAMLDGDWDIVAGAMFGDAWRHHLHTIDPFPIPDDWQIWRGADDGFSAPASVHWLTQDPKIKTFYVIDELYRARMRPDDFAKRVKHHDESLRLINWDGEEYRNTNRLRGVLDNSAFGDSGNQNDIPRGAQLNKLGCMFVPAEKWPGSRIARVKYFHQLMGPNPHDPRGMPGVRFFRKHCPYATETIPTLPRDEKDIEDVDTDAEDHAFDSVTYGLQWKKNGFKSRSTAGV